MQREQDIAQLSGAAYIPRSAYRIACCSPPALAPPLPFRSGTKARSQAARSSQGPWAPSCRLEGHAGTMWSG